MTVAEVAGIDIPLLVKAHAICCGDITAMIGGAIGDAQAIGILCGIFLVKQFDGALFKCTKGDAVDSARVLVLQIEERVREIDGISTATDSVCQLDIFNDGLNFDRCASGFVNDDTHQAGLVVLIEEILVVSIIEVAVIAELKAHREPLLGFWMDGCR